MNAYKRENVNMVVYNLLKASYYIHRRINFKKNCWKVTIGVGW